MGKKAEIERQSKCPFQPKKIPLLSVFSPNKMFLMTDKSLFVGVPHPLEDGPTAIVVMKHSLLSTISRKKR